MLRDSKIARAWMLAAGATILLTASGARAQPGSSPAGGGRSMQEMVLQWGYLQSQYAALNPPDILGGPIRINVRQDSGGVRVVLPEGRPGSEPVTSVPDLSQGRFTLQALDATATDAVRSRDQVNFQASWKDPQGNTYAVRCDRVISRGVGYPVFGGVATNQVLYSLHGWGVPATPAGFTYVAFWGTGDALQNGRVVGRSVMVQGALIEVPQGYRSTTGAPVLRREFHVLVMPFSPASGTNAAVQRGVGTGETPWKGGRQRCWHVVFDDPRVTAGRVPPMPQTRLAGGPQGGPNFGSFVGRDAPREAVVVEMTNALRYVPSAIKIAVGQTVKWRNVSHFTHTVTCDPSLASDPRDVQLPEGAEPFNSGVMRPGAAFGYTFKTPGLYRYFCIPHEYAGMVGTVEVIGQP
jgi:plastocyanin